MPLANDSVALWPWCSSLQPSASKNPRNDATEQTEEAHNPSILSKKGHCILARSHLTCALMPHKSTKKAQKKHCLLLLCSLQYQWVLAHFVPARFDI